MVYNKAQLLLPSDFSNPPGGQLLSFALEATPVSLFEWINEAITWALCERQQARYRSPIDTAK